MLEERHFQSKPLKMFTSEEHPQHVSSSSPHINNMFNSVSGNNYGSCGPLKPHIKQVISQPSVSNIDSNSSYNMSTASSQGESPPPQNYQLKTMCLAKKSVQMPTKEEHGFLLFCGLGARKWQCAIDCNSLTFKQAILNIYPRLRSVIGYNLWTLTKDKKTFEKIPEKINTPRRMRSYLGTHFTGCLIIVPVSDIVLMEEKREHLRQIDIKHVKDVNGISSVNIEHETRHRSLCLICGKIEKTAGTGSFHKINEETINCGDGNQIISKKLTDILGFNFEQSKRKFIASTEICKRCLRSVTDVIKMEEQLKKHKEDLVSNFFSTTSKFNKNQGSINDDSKQSLSPQYSSSQSLAVDNALAPTTSQERKGFSTNPSQNGYPHPFLVQSLPPSVAFLNQPKQLPYGNGIVQFYRPTYPEYGANPSDGNSPERRENFNYRNGSDYAASEVDSSCFLSITPPPKDNDFIPGHQDQETDSHTGSISPRPFDTRSYASTFSFRSASSIRSKGEQKSYGMIQATPKEVPNRPEEHNEKINSEQPEMNGYPEQTDNYKRTNEKTAYESTEASPRSEQSPRSAGTPGSESFESITPNTSSPTPDDNLAEEERAERRKPWKKRKRVQEPEQDDSSGDKKLKNEENSESSDCRDQIDASTSDQN